MFIIGGEEAQWSKQISLVLCLPERVCAQAPVLVCGAVSIHCEDNSLKTSHCEDRRTHSTALPQFL